ncbi:LamG-like jellyroll fold domain-containing protein [Planctomycetota bacterium]
MSSRFACSVSFIFVLGLLLTGAGDKANAALVGWWKLDETSGIVARDASGNGHNGTLKGDPQWVAGQVDGALKLDGEGDYVDIGSVGISGVDLRTLAGWAKASTTAIPSGTSIFGFAPDDTTDGTYFDIEVDDAGNYAIHVQGWDADICALDTEWHHFAATYDGEGGTWYLDGEETGSEAGAVGTLDQVRIGAKLSESNYFPGIVDDVRIYNTVLTAGEIMGLTAGHKAYDPTPPDAAFYKGRWVSLGWSPGDTAASHDVYFGTGFDDVSNGTGQTFQGNQTILHFVVGFPGNPLPDGLVPGTTYFWRIDEVETDGVTKHTGDVWSFWLAPSTAYDPDPPDGTEFVGPNNVTLSWTPGFDAKLHTIYFGDNFDDVNNAAEGLPQGLATYAPGPLELEKVYYWRVDEFDAVATHKGDIWSFTTPGAVGNPQPAYGATDVGMNTVLNWTPANSAASHQLYFGTDKETVRNADTISPEFKGSKALGAESYDPRLLEPKTVYYWRVDEVDGQGNTSTGPLWSFTTGTFLIVDDFENYTNDDAAGEAIWQTWIDGFGMADNGAQVGYLLPSYAERTIVHSGLQSMPLQYFNMAGVRNSEAVLTLTAPRNWTQASVGELSLWFRGGADNDAEPLYVAIANKGGLPAIVPYEDANASLTLAWTKWVIPLQTFAGRGIDLSDVDKTSIGLGSKADIAAPGGSGMMYFDDIRLDQ